MNTQISGMSHKIWIFGDTVVLYSNLAWRKIPTEFWKTATSDTAKLIIHVHLIERLMFKRHSQFCVNNLLKHGKWDNPYAGNWIKKFRIIVCFHLLSWKSNLPLNINTQWLLHIQSAAVLPNYPSSTQCMYVCVSYEYDTKLTLNVERY
jgi:hypothetical protein